MYVLYTGLVLSPRNNRAMNAIDDTFDPNRMVDPVKRKVMLRIQMEEEFEPREVDELAEADPDVVLWRSLHSEDKVQELISEKVASNRDWRKFQKYKRYYLEVAGPLERAALLAYLGMPPEESPIVGFFKSAISSVASLLITNHHEKKDD